MPHAWVEPLAPGADGPRALLHLKVVPGGSRDALGGPLGDRFKVRCSAPPEGGKANKEVLALLAKTLGVPSRALCIVRGTASPLKSVEVSGADAATVGRLLYG